MRTTNAYVSLVHDSIRQKNILHSRKYYAENKDRMQWTYYYNLLGKDVVDSYIEDLGPEEAKLKIKALRKKTRLDNIKREKEKAKEEN